MKKAYVQYVAALLLFGSNGIVAGYISLDSYEIVWMRTLIGGLLLLAICLLSGHKIRFCENKRDILFSAVSGAAMGASWLFLYEAYRQIGVGMATLAYYCGPVLVMALSPLLFHEAFTRIKAAGFLAVLCGVYLVNAPTLADGKSGWGLFCGGMSAVLYAVMVLSSKKAKRLEGVEKSMLQLLFGFLTVSVFVWGKQGPTLAVLPGDWAPLFLLGLLNTGVGCYWYFSAIGRLPAQSVAVCGYLEPLAAVVLSVLILGESMQPMQVLGAVLILGGAAFGECAGRRKRPSLSKRRE